MKIGSMVLASLVALTTLTVSHDDASADRRPRPSIRVKPGAPNTKARPIAPNNGRPIAPNVPRVGAPNQVRPAPNQAPARLRSITATQFQAEAKADATKLLGELHHGLRVTDVGGLSGASTLLSSVAGMLAGNPAGIQLRFRKSGAAIVKLSRYAGSMGAAPASPATPATTKPPATPADADAADADADADEDEDEDEAEE